MCRNMGNWQVGQAVAQGPVERVFRVRQLDGRTAPRRGCKAAVQESAVLVEQVDVGV